MSLDFQVVVFELDERRYGLRLSAVDRILRAVDVTPLLEAPEVVWGIIDVQGQIVPVLSLRERFGLPERPIGVSDQFVLARTRQRTVALVVDGVRGVFERAVAEVIGSDKILPDLKQIEGVIRLDDGMVLIHDLDRFLSLDEERAVAQAISNRENDEP
ncbi:MAG: chemotaxis protein CheW [Candidatus Binatia bacterium]